MIFSLDFFFGAPDMLKYDRIGSWMKIINRKKLDEYGINMNIEKMIDKLDNLSKVYECCGCLWINGMIKDLQQI